MPRRLRCSSPAGRLRGRAQPHSQPPQLSVCSEAPQPLEGEPSQALPDPPQPRSTPPQAGTPREGAQPPQPLPASPRVTTGGGGPCPARLPSAFPVPIDPQPLRARLPTPSPHRSRSRSRGSPGRAARSGRAGTGGGGRAPQGLRSRRRRAGLTDPRAPHPPPSAASPALSAPAAGYWLSPPPLRALIGQDHAVSQRFLSALSFSPACFAAVAIAMSGAVRTPGSAGPGPPGPPAGPPSRARRGWGRSGAAQPPLGLPSASPFPPVMAEPPQPARPCGRSVKAACEALPVTPPVGTARVSPWLRHLKDNVRCRTGRCAVKNTGRKRGRLAQFRPQDARRPRGCEGGGRRLEPSPCWGSAAPGPLLSAVTSPPGVTHGSVAP